MRDLCSGLHDSLWTQLSGSIRKELMDVHSNEWLVRYSIINNIYNNNSYVNTTAMNGTYMETQLLVQPSSSPASIVVVTTTGHWRFGCNRYSIRVSAMTLTAKNHHGNVGICEHVNSTNKYPTIYQLSIYWSSTLIISAYSVTGSTISLLIDSKIIIK